VEQQAHGALASQRRAEFERLLDLLCGFGHDRRAQPRHHVGGLGSGARAVIGKRLDAVVPGDDDERRENGQGGGRPEQPDGAQHHAQQERAPSSVPRKCLRTHRYHCP
jgi:hypothetical protein